MKSKLVVSFFISLIIIASTLIVYRSRLFERAENIVFDAKMKTYRSASVPPRNLKVVLVDDASISAMEKAAGRWPWPRAIWSDLLRFLSIGGAKMVLFDILFTEHQDRQNDEIFAEATAASGNVVHSMIIKHEEQDVEQKYNVQLNRPLPESFQRAFAVRNVQGVMRMSNQERNNDFLLPIEGLQSFSRAIGVVEFTPDGDGVLRRTRPLREYHGAYYPVLGLAPFIDDSTKVIIGEKAIQINDRILPIDIDGNFLINMYDINNVEPISIGGVLASMAKIDRGDVEDLVVRPEEFKDSVVFVGVSAVGGADLKATPLSPRTPGVILHISLAGNYLMNDFLMPPDRRFTIAAMVCGVLLTVGVVFFSKQFGVRAVFPIVFPAFFIWYSFYVFKSNMIVETVPFVFATVSSGFLSFGYLTFTEAAEKRRVSKLFTQYVNKDVLNEVLHNYKDYLKSSAGQKVEITVLFSDIRGFTTISETTPPEKIVEMLNIHFSHMADIILKHNGTIDKYIGDAIMAFWGAPVKDASHAENAVKAAIEMIQELEFVNRELREKGLNINLRIGVGINTGEATIGEIGSEKKKNYTIVGDTVNLASRLESITKEYNSPIVLSEYTYERIKNTIECSALGNVKVKGREQPVTIYKPVVDDQVLKTN